VGSKLVETENISVGEKFVGKQKAEKKGQKRKGFSESKGAGKKIRKTKGSKWEMATREKNNEPKKDTGAGQKASGEDEPRFCKRGGTKEEVTRRRG